MPFRSEAQRRYLWTKEPKVARSWADKYGSKIVPSKHPVAKVIKQRRGR